MAEVLEQLPVATELEDAFASTCPRDPDVPVTIDVDGLLVGPAGHVPRAAPALEQVAVWIELEDGRSRDAAIGARRVGRRPVLVRPDLARAIEHPHVIVAVDGERRDLLHDPLVRQRLRPERVYAVRRWCLRAR